MSSSILTFVLDLILGSVLAFWALPWPQRVENEPKIQSKSKVRIGGPIENENCSTTWIDPKSVFEPYPDPKNSPLLPPKSQKWPNLSQNQKLELKKTYKL